MEGEFYINDKDAYTTWGISMDTSSLSALMTPPPMKEFIENKSRLENGKRVITSNPRVDERNITLTFNLTAKSEDQFFVRYNSFCEELSFRIRPNTSSSQFRLTVAVPFRSMMFFLSALRLLFSGA